MYSKGSRNERNSQIKATTMRGVGMSYVSTARKAKQFFKSAFLGTMLGVLIPCLAFGQATLLPNAAQQYLDNSGKPLASGQVYYYIPSTSTPKTVWQDSAETTPQANPVQLDAYGRPQPAGQTFGAGLYRQKVIDVNGITIWDVVTSSTGTSSGSSPPPAYSEGVMVGTIVPWVSTTLPTHYLYTAGQAISRTTYSQLFSAITFAPIVLCVNGIASLSVSTTISDLVPIGTPVEATCLAPGTTVIAKSTGSLVLSVAATATASTTATILPWGNGDGNTTFNVPDLRGRSLIGRNNMNSSIGTALNSTYYLNGGTAVNPNAVNAIGGNQSATLTTSNLPPYTPSGTTDGKTPVYNNAFNPASGTTVTNALSLANSTNTSAGLFDFVTGGGGITFTGTPQGGTNIAFSIMQPGVTSDYIIKALPDDSPTGPGVTSIQGMTGALSCGTNVTCNSQTISVTLGALATASVGAGLSLVSGVLSATGGAGSSLIIKVSDYGGVCNGSADDTTALVNWVAAINSSAESTVYAELMPGTCTLNSASSFGLVFTRGNINFNGKGSSLQVTGTTAINCVISSVNQSHIHYYNINFVGNNEYAGTGFGNGCAIAFLNSNTNIYDIVVEDCNFDNFAGNYVIYLEPTSPFANSINYVNINRNNFTSYSGNCAGPTNISINCAFIGILGVGNNAGTPTPLAWVRSINITNNNMRADYVKSGIIMYGNVQDAYVTGNKVYNAGQLGGSTDDHGSYAILAYENESPSTTFYSQHVVWENNYIFNARDNCFYMAGQWTNSIINGNVCEFQTSTATATIPKGGISVNGGVSTTITNNRISNIAADGITLIAPPAAFGAINGEWTIANNSVNGQLSAAIKVQNSSGYAETKLSITGNNVFPTGTASGITVETFSNSNPGSSYNDLKIDGNNINGGSYGIRLFGDAGASIFTSTSVSHNQVQLPSTVGIDVSNIGSSGGPLLLDGNMVYGSPTSYSFNIGATVYGVFQNNVCSSQGVGYCWGTAGAKGSMRNNSFDQVATALIVNAIGVSDLGRVVPNYTPTGAQYVVQNLLALETGASGSKYVNREWFYNIGSTAWVEERMLTGN